MFIIWKYSGMIFVFILLMGINCYVTMITAIPPVELTITRSMEADLMINTSSNFCIAMNAVFFPTTLNCQCKHTTTFFFDEYNPGCSSRRFYLLNDVDNISRFQKTINVSNSFHSQKLCFRREQHRIQKVSLWNIAVTQESLLSRENINGVWIDITGPFIKNFTIYNKSLLHIDLNLTKWQGQLIKLNTNCKHDKTIYLKLLGQISYPYNLRDLDITSTTTSDKENITSEKESKTKLIVSVAVVIPIIPILGVVLMLFLCRRRVPRCVKKDTHINTSHSFDETFRYDDTAFTYFRELDNDNDNFQIPTELPHEINKRRNHEKIVIKEGGGTSSGKPILYSNAVVPISPNTINTDNRYEDLNLDNFPTINNNHDQYEEIVNNTAAYQSLKTTKPSNSSSLRQASAFNNPMYDDGSPSIIRLNPDTTSTTMYAREQNTSSDEIREPIYHDLEME